MDPNGGKKGMFNKLGRKEAILRLEQESFNRVTVSFYRYIIIENVESFRDKLYSEWKSLSAYGRIYLAKDARMQSQIFKSSYPDLSKFETYRKNIRLDDKFNSDQSKRLGIK